MGKVEVRQIFNIPKVGTIAGVVRHRGQDHAQGACSASCATRSSSSRARSARCAASRTTSSEVAEGYECGVGLEGYNDIKEGDIIESFEIETIAPTLENPTGERR